MMTSGGTTTLEPRIVMAGFNCPSSLNNDLQSTLAKGLFGSGSTGVPWEGKLVQRRGRR